MKSPTGISGQINTDFVWINPQRCRACWRCLRACPKQIVGKTGGLWNRHVVFINSEQCSGCKKCIATCPHGVFKEM
ncbi:MAG: 4Fe-4S binding protein [Prevotellaceae bacterium]|nr:4Fe-4S binding protein [Prevotellaceae bacterium]